VRTSATKEGVTAILFVNDLEEGVSYRYWFLPRERRAEQTGDGKVPEKCEKVFEKNEPASKEWPQDGVMMGAVDKGGQLFITARPIKAEWSAPRRVGAGSTICPKRSGYRSQAPRNSRSSISSGS
jgi:hypothetical protein